LGQTISLAAHFSFASRLALPTGQALRTTF
jgi:hypothetical protein